MLVVPGSTRLKRASDCPRLHPETEVILLRAAQESLTNVRKYAQASQVVITLSYMEDLVALDVRDDGIGFDTPQMNTGDLSGGFGNRGMRERVEQLGGTLVVESTPGKGTALMIELLANADSWAAPKYASGRGRSLMVEHVRLSQQSYLVSIL